MPSSAPDSERATRGRPRDEEAVAERQQQILAEAMRQFAREGYRQTDVQHIADQLGCGKGTVYRYFPTKEQLFLSAVDLGMRQLSEAVAEATNGLTDALTSMRAAITAYLAFFDGHPDVVELLIQERAEFKDRERPTYVEHRDANIGEWRCLVQSLIASGRFRPMSAEQVLQVMDCTLYGAIFVRHFGDDQSSLQQMAERILDTLLHGCLSRSNQD